MSRTDAPDITAPESPDFGTAEPVRAARTRTDALIGALVEALAPTRAAPGRRRAALTWVVLAVGLTTTGILATGPLRPGWTADLATSGLALQSVLGLTTALLCLFVGLEVDVPGARRPKAALCALGVVAGGWLLATALPGATLVSLGLDMPAPAMAGKRAHCAIEGLVIAAPTAVVALVLLARRTMRPGLAGGAALGLAAGALPALAMQIACMLEPGHALRFHVAPAFEMALGTALVARFVLARD